MIWVFFTFLTCVRCPLNRLVFFLSLLLVKGRWVI